MKIRPLQDRVIVKRVEEEEKTKGGIIIPDTAKEKPMEGKVIAVGKGKLLEAIENPYKNAESPGPSVVNYLAGKGAKVAVAGGFGAKIVEVMKAKDITAVSFKGSAQDAVKKVLQSK